MTRNMPRPVDPEQARIGNTLRTIREIRGYKLGEFATELGISYAYLSNIEAGRKRLTPQLLAKAAVLLDVRQIAIVRDGTFSDEVA
jgi:transcriptional regulator with XRE-family HTH domain